MSIKERIQQLIETNQQRRVTELIDTVDHIFDRFENLLCEDTWDTDIVNGKAYLQKTVPSDNKLRLLGIGLTDDGVIIQAVLPPSLDDVDVLTYEQHLSEIFQKKNLNVRISYSFSYVFPHGI